jgi:hypothetical protein
MKYTLLVVGWAASCISVGFFGPLIYYFIRDHRAARRRAQAHPLSRSGAVSTKKRM